MDAALQGWIAPVASTLGTRLSGLLSSTAFRCLLVFALGGFAGRIFDHFANRDECDGKKRHVCKPISLRTVEKEEILETEECTVCLELLNPKYCAAEFADLKCVRLVCGHAFHADCIGKWLARDSRQSCPVCRMDAATQDDQVLRRRTWSPAK